MTPAPERLIALLEADPDLGRGVDAADWDAARRYVVGRRLELEPGTWTPEQAESLHGGRHHGFGILIVEGLLTREHFIDQRLAATLYGPGDVLCPWDAGAEMLPEVPRWTVNVPTLVAVLDDRFLVGVRQWPTICARILERMAGQETRMSVHAAINTIARVEVRVTGVLWLLADLWGRVTPTGVHVPLRLTHEALGRLIGAQRPTVSLALASLADEGSVTRRPDGTYLLRQDSKTPLVPHQEGGEPAPEAMLIGTAGDGLAATDGFSLQRGPARPPERHFRAPAPGSAEDFAALRAHVEQLRARQPAMQADVAATVDRARAIVGRSRDIRAAQSQARQETLDTS